MNIKSLEEAQKMLNIGPRLEAMMAESGSIRPQHQHEDVQDAGYRAPATLRLQVDGTGLLQGQEGETTQGEQGHRVTSQDEEGHRLATGAMSGYKLTTQAEQSQGLTTQVEQDHKPGDRVTTGIMPDCKLTTPAEQGYKVGTDSIQGSVSSGQQGEECEEGDPGSVYTERGLGVNGQQGERERGSGENSRQHSTSTHTVHNLLQSSSTGKNQQIPALPSSQPHHQGNSAAILLSAVTPTPQEVGGQKGELSSRSLHSEVAGNFSSEEEEDFEDQDPPASTSLGKLGRSARNPCLGDLVTATVDEIPKRGRVTNKMKQLLQFKDASGGHQTSVVSAPLHKGPLHSHKDRVRETLLRCEKTDSAECLYLVLGTHYHCRACKGVVREDDLIAHRYVHSCLRLISDVNISQVVLNGRFCENKKCVECISPQSIGGFVIHMHCAHCDELLETGHSFHQHLKSAHRDVWSLCVVYSEADTAMEQCLFCRGYFDSQEVLSGHMTDRHFSKFNNREMQMYCIVCCGEDFPQLEVYRIHMALEHKTLDASLFKPQNLPLKCLECGQEVTGKQNMQKHAWQTHRQGHNKVCTLCGGIFDSLTALRDHESERHLGSCFPCTDCNRTFKCQLAHQKHFALVHSKNYRYFCDPCSRGFQGEFQYLRHLSNSHHGDRETVQCEPGCGRGFVGAESLGKHRKVCLQYRAGVKDM